MTSGETRLALARQGVRRPLWFAWLAGGLAWTGVVEGPGALSAAGGWSGPLVPAALAWAALAAGLAGRKLQADPRIGLLVAVGPLVVAGLVPRPPVTAAAVAIGALTGGWVAGAAGAAAARATGPRAAAAAAGLVVTAAAGGVVLLPLSVLWLAGFTAVLVVLLRPETDGHPGPSAAPATPAPRPQATPLLRATGVHVRLGPRQVLSGVDLELREGELTVLAGANGSGKSTLLRVLGGHLVPESGDLELGGRSVLGSAPEEMARSGVSLVSGARPVFPDLTVEENLRVATWLSTATQGQALAAAKEVFPEIEHLAGRVAGTLSGGEQRLVALAQSILSTPSVLLADEVTLGLSTELRSRAIGLLRALAAEGTAVLVVDHELLDLLPNADRTVVLEDGHVVEGPATGVARFMPAEGR